MSVFGSSAIMMADDNVGQVRRLKWEVGNAKETARAARVFKEYVTRGWLAFGETSERKSQIFAFDANIERIILVPYIDGG